MKELTIEEKAQRYDEALERAKGVHNSAKSDKENGVTDKITEYTVQLTETIFPELKVNDDERIRKHLIGVVELYYGNTDEQEKKDCLAWLEKQCGQKPAEEVNGEDYGIDGLYHAQRILERTLGKVDGYQSDDGILEHKCAITAVKKLYEKKPTEWSEEDEGFLNLLLAIFTNEHPNGVFSTDNITVFKGNCVTSNRIITWLKSLKERYTWKPSDEQIDAVKSTALDVAKFSSRSEQLRLENEPYYKALVSLYNDLEKLKE